MMTRIEQGYSWGCVMRQAIQAIAAAESATIVKPKISSVRIATRDGRCTPGKG